MIQKIRKKHILARLLASDLIRGFTLVEVLVVTALLGVLALAGTQVAQTMLKSQQQSTTTFQASMLLKNMVTAINSQQGWQNTISAPANNLNGDATMQMSCLGSGPGSKVCAVGPNPFTLILDGTGATGKTVFDSSGTNGFTQQGASCTGFTSVAGAGNAACPLSYNMTWQPICSSYPCSNANFQNTLITLNVVYNPPANNRISFNANNYSASFYQGSTGAGCSWVTGASGITYNCPPVAVGIGTTTPTNTLTLSSTSGTDTGIDIANTSAGGILPWRLQTVGSSVPGRIGNFEIWQVGGSNVFTILPSGNVGMGTTAPGAKLEVNGTVLVDGNATAQGYYYSSDRSLKRDIHEIDHALEKALQLRGVNFTWKKDGKEDIGVIAQEVEKVFPELVHTNAEGVKSVEYGNLTAVLIEALKEEDRKTQDLDVRIRALEKKAKP